MAGLQYYFFPTDFYYPRPPLANEESVSSPKHKLNTALALSSKHCALLHDLHLAVVDLQLPTRPITTTTKINFLVACIHRTEEVVNGGVKIGLVEEEAMVLILNVITISLYSGFLKGASTYYKHKSRTEQARQDHHNSSMARLNACKGLGSCLHLASMAMLLEKGSGNITLIY
ncbi:hypothetical protein SADUNF_Sadunf16G0038800 [Salix dunnii]|uniref:Uncharacterized protein n=1 Tax=Salix dunnii TaxID=1413687 RepID=A0A835J6Z1_9ROSI|nr:hypothetical protein SADUNF_Sadunf16G0038800 [Salix dunnii]